MKMLCLRLRSDWGDCWLGTICSPYSEGFLRKFTCKITLELSQDKNDDINCTSALRIFLFKFI